MKNLFVKFVIYCIPFLIAGFILFASTKANNLRFEGPAAGFIIKVDKSFDFSPSLKTTNRFEK